MKNFLAGLACGVILCLAFYYFMPKEKIERINIDERVQREIDSSGFNSLDPIGRGRFLDSLAHIRAK